MGRERAGLLEDASLAESERISLCETLDRVLHKGVVVRGDVVISVAGVDLVYLSLQLVLSSIDTALRAGILPPALPPGPPPRPEGAR